MKARSLSVYTVFFFVILLSLVINIEAQQPQSTPQNDDDVVRVNTNLIQTDVMVFDKNGKFVQGLQRQQFELKVDGKVRDISFFEQIKAGKIDEEAKIAAARGQARTNQDTSQPQTILQDRGRIIYLFVDDFHLSAESMIRMKKMLLQFVDRQIGQNDQAAVITASGQLGFLQQLTDNKDVLKKAINKLKYHKADVRDYDRPAMSAFQALLIERYNKDILGYFVDEVLKSNPGMKRDTAEMVVHSRARNILQQASYYVDISLQSIKKAMSESAQLPGRKLFFYVTDGFLLDNNFGNSFSLISQITSLAARANTVIYSLDARGLVSGFTDASSDAPFDPTGRVSRNSMSEISASQDGLYALAKDTGGRAIINTNDAEPLLEKALQETSEYYLLAWATDEDLIRGEKFRKVEVNVIGRPDLVVKSRKGFISNQKPEKTKPLAENNSRKPAKDPITVELISAIKSVAPLETLPTALTAFYFNSPQYGLHLSAAIEMQKDALTFETTGEKPTAVVDVIGYVINEQGKTIASFQERWTITSLKAINEQSQRGVVTNFLSKITPGLYQIRVATREAKTGKIGKAFTWIEVPDLNSKKLALSSLLIAERRTSELQKTSDEKTDPLLQESSVNISRRFSSSSYLRFITNIYNATVPAIPDAIPDLVLQVQVFRNDQPVTTTPLSKLQTNGVKDFSQIPYAAEISLQGMPAGYYVLQMTVIDRNAKTTASQKINFIIE